MLLLCHSNMCQLLFQAGLLITCLRWTFAAANPEGTVYEKVGGTAVLQPGSAVTRDIRTVTWKHGADKAAELYRGETICYWQYEGRCQLNTTRGGLIINHLTLSDSGFYSAEINGYEVNTVQLQVMTPVPKPSVSTWYDPTKTYCLLTCEGTTSDPELLQYRWNEENDWSHSMKILNITKENKEPEFSCEIKNPVSSSRSDPVQNPFIPGNLLWIIAVVLVILLIVIVTVVLYYKKKNIWQKGKETAAPEADPEQRTGEAGDEGEPGEGTVYVEVDGTAVLHPGSADTGDIRTVKWICNGQTAAQWSGRNVFFYGQFEGRCELNTWTGELTIKHLTLSDSGRYSAKINDKETNTVQLQVMCKETAAPVHEEVDGTVVLHPGSADTGDIRTVTWKHDGSRVAELYGRSVFFFQQFKDRCELNTMTGELTIKHLTLSDSGRYSAEINGKETNTVQLQVKSKETAAPGTVSVEVDGTAVLHPGSEVPGYIWKVIWKHNGDKAAEWSRGNVSFSNQFKDRCELNTMTGELTIKHLTLSDSGSYSAKINSKEPNTVELQVM